MKRKKMFGLGMAALALSFMLAVGGCDTGSSPSNPFAFLGGGGGGVSSYSGSGTITNYSGDGVMHAQYGIFGNNGVMNQKDNIGTISNGNFTFDLASVPVGTLYSLADFFRDYDSNAVNNVSISDNSTKCLMAIVVGVKQGDPVGFYSYLTYGLQNGSQEDMAVFFYTDRAVKITGNITGSDYSDTWNVNASQGWNMIYNMKTGNGAITVSVFTTTVPPGLSWYLVDASKTIPYALSGTVLTFHPYGDYTPADLLCPKWDFVTGSGPGGATLVGKWQLQGSNANNTSWVEFTSNGKITSYSLWTNTAPSYTVTPANASSGTIQAFGSSASYVLNGTTLIYNPGGMYSNGMGMPPYTPADPNCPRWILKAGTGGTFPIGIWESSNNGINEKGRYEWVEFTASSATFGSEQTQTGAYIVDSANHNVKILWDSNH